MNTSALKNMLVKSFIPLMVIPVIYVVKVWVHNQKATPHVAFGRVNSVTMMLAENVFQKILSKQENVKQKYTFTETRSIHKQFLTFQLSTTLARF